MDGFGVSVVFPQSVAKRPSLKQTQAEDSQTLSPRRCDVFNSFTSMVNSGNHPKIIGRERKSEERTSQLAMQMTLLERGAEKSITTKATIFD